MFYPRCPKCGGLTTTTHSEAVNHATRRARSWLFGQQLAGHPHPVVKLAVLGVTVGNEIYRRAPGGGEKVCTDCGHRFR